MTGKTAAPPQSKQYQYRLQTGQTYQADDAQGLIDQLGKAQENASKHIEDQKKQIQQLQQYAMQMARQQSQARLQPQPQAQAGNFDKNKFEEQFLQDPRVAIKDVLADMLQTPDPAQYIRQAYDGANQFSQLVAVQQFAQMQPDFPTHDQNAMATLLSTAQGTGRVDAGSLQQAWYQLKTQGVIQPTSPPQPQQQQAPEPPQPNPQLGAMGPMPGEGSNSDAGFVDPAALKFPGGKTMQDIENMSMDEMEAFARENGLYYE